MKRFTDQQICDLAESDELKALLDLEGAVLMVRDDEVVCRVEGVGEAHKIHVRSFEPADESATIALWEACGLLRPWNDPRRDIARKLAQDPELFLACTLNGRLIGTAMVGYDGHRGWVYYLAVAKEHRHVGLGRRLMKQAERLLVARGCPKLSLMIRSSNNEVIDFYSKLGYTQDDVVSLGKRLIEDAPSKETRT